MHWTDIIEVPITDILDMAGVDSKGFTDNAPTSPLTGTEYRNGDYVNPDWIVSDAAPLNGQKEDGDPDETKYFYKRWGPSDCIDFLAELGII